MKRFYKTVETLRTDSGWQVTLDGRAVKTVKGSPQIVPGEKLARMLAAEWDAQGEKIDPATLPNRDMADYALDIVSADQAAHADKILTYGDTDTLLYRADPDEPLYARQQEVWEPIVGTFEDRHGVKLTRISGIIHKPQSDEALATLRTKLVALPPLELGALEAMTSLAASLIVALSALESEAEDRALALWNAASLEEQWQADLWGRDEEAEERRAKREQDFLTAWKFARLARA